MFCALLLAAAVAAPEAHGTAVVTTEDRLHRVQERRAALEREVAALRGQEKGLLGQVERLELQVRLRAQELREIQLGLRQMREKAEITEKQASELERSLSATRPTVVARARALYKLGEFSYMRMLLSIDRPVDVLRAYRFVGTLARQDQSRVARFRRDLVALAETRADLEKKQQEMQAVGVEVDKRRRRLDGERREKTALLTRIVQEKETHLAFAEELQHAESQLQELTSGDGESGGVSVPIAVLRGALPWPVEGRIRVGFGPRKHPKFETLTAHNGVEIESTADSPVHAVHEGTVAYAAHFLGYGMMVVVDHGQKQHTLYAHLGDVAVAVHDHVTAGQVLGTLPPEEPANLYFEVRLDGRPVDPEDWLAKPAKKR